MFALHPPPTTEAYAFFLLLNTLEWGEVHLTSSYTHTSLAVAENIQALEQFRMPSYGAVHSFEGFISKVVKPSGNWRVVCTHDAEGAVKVAAAMQSSKIDRERGALLLSSQAAWGRYFAGTVILVEDGLETAESWGHYEYLAVKKAIVLIESCVPPEQPAISQLDLLVRVENLTEDRVLPVSYNLLNYKTDGISTCVGKIADNSIEFYEEVIYPGNVTTLNFSSPRLTISGNTARFNPDGSFSNRGAVLTTGILPMVYLINLDPSFLPNFILDFQETNCGIEVVDYTYMQGCFRGFENELGLAYLESDIGPATKANIAIFEEMGINIPHIGISYYEEELYDDKLYPNLLVTTPFDIYRFATIPYVLKGIGWENILFRQ